ncbi:hypothetical protein O0I10_001342 [Lichtheimia ornata]|uniref:Gustatory receptor n=1 Tax=Lichtheimia ornata TaxID=688661 RepID=A0AAD8DHX9_9FUNG|nr:uncharacterized protein O0I10_001342 [Lichtheimia ornata]KAJ8663165.1 hypothetical protein O0I10_001342 [Lichtheimia ornata]
MSAFILALVLVPAGLCMKIALHLCAQQPPHVAMDNEYPGDDDDDASLQAAHLLSRILPSTLRDTMQNWFWFPHQYSSNTTIRKVIYAPFPVCWMSSATNVFHSISIESLLYNFTNSGRQLWQLFLCRLEHFHLGLFLIGGLWTLRLVFTTLNSVLTTHQRHLHAHPWLLAGNDHEGEDEDEEEVNIEHHENELMRAAVALQAAAEHSDVIDRIVETLGKLVKSFVLLYCCWIVVLVWIHFFVFAFYVDPINQGYTMPAVDMGLWVFRWIITTFAVIDCVKKCIYDQIGCSINEEQVISLHHSR